MAGIDTLFNVQQHWNLDDLADAHEALDIKDEAEQLAMEKIKNERT